jgi:hypothetical protein
MTRVVSALVGLSMVVGGATVTATGAQPADTPGQVKATYVVEFGGVSIGTFEFASKLAATGVYGLDAKGELSLLFGAIKWSGSASAAGHTAGERTRPNTFDFGFRGSNKTGSTRVAFAGDAVSAVAHVPPREPNPETVPVLPAHLKGVLDPMSASLALTKAVGGNPCARRLPIYDGKERFDLVLSPKGTTEIRERRPSGQPATAVVCRVKYVPISGHKPKDSDRFVQRAEGIDLVMRPIPSLGLYVPHTVIVPTQLGTIRILAKSVSISTAQQQIALSH